MGEYRVVALAQDTADEVRATMRAPGYGHPAHVEVARGHGPCRLCLRTFRQGEEDRVLFTYNPFPKEAALPDPGPVFVHKAECARHEGPGFPSGLLGVRLTLEGYDGTGQTIGRLAVSSDPDRSVREVLALPRVAYAHLRNTEAGCFVGRVERVRSGTNA
jgi:hypothetical protein